VLQQTLEMHPQIAHDSLEARLKLDVNFFVAYMRDFWHYTRSTYCSILQVFAICESCMDTLFEGWLSELKEVVECKCSFYHGLNNVAMTLAMSFVFF
jgi:hypothetical protein